MNVPHDEFATLASLDLNTIKVKLMHQRSGEGWTLDRVNAVEKEYRRFLHLTKKYPDEAISPSLDVDRFWHQHILDTVKYARDCEAIFGYFLHHYPYLGLGLGGRDDSAEREHAGERMRELYEETFSDSYIPTATGFAKGATEAADKAFCIKAGAQAFCIKAGAQAFCVKTGAQEFSVEPAAQALDVGSSAQAFCVKATTQAFCVRTISDRDKYQEEELVH
jgi:hypothetical protein